MDLCYQAQSIVVASITVVIVAAFVSYRVFYHPLAKYPGPFLAKVSNARSVYLAYFGRRHLDLFKLHRQYGDVVRTGPNTLSFCTATAYHSIHGFKSNVRKADFYKSTGSPEKTFSTIDTQAAAHQRRILAKPLSDAVLRELEPHILSSVETFCKCLMKPENALAKVTVDDWSLPRNIATWSNFLVFDILGELCVGRSFDTLTTSEHRYAIPLLHQALRITNTIGQMMSLHRFGLHIPLLLMYNKAIRRFADYTLDVYKERTKLGTHSDRRDFYHYLLDAKDPEGGSGLTDEQLQVESMGFIVAGSDTTSTALSATMFYLVHYPETLTRLTRIIRDNFSSLDAIRIGPELSSCSYLRACIDEALRLSPPGPGAFPRQILPGGLEIDGEIFEKDTVVGVSAYVLHRNAVYFKEPERYRPERWLVEEVGTEEVERARNAFAPFGQGPRTCVGRSLAYSELTITVARLVWLYDMRLATGGPFGDTPIPPTYVTSVKEPEYPMKDWSVAVTDGPMMQFRPRAS